MISLHRFYINGGQKQPKNRFGIWSKYINLNHSSFEWADSASSSKGV